MIGEDRHRGVEGSVGEREVLGGCGDAWRSAGWSLRAHDGGGLDSGDVAVGRLVGSGARADVEDGPRVSERLPNPPRDAWLGTPRPAVGTADLIVERTSYASVGCHDDGHALSRRAASGPARTG